MRDNISYRLLRLLETSGVGVAKINSILDHLTGRNIQAGSLNPQALKGFLNEKQLIELMSNLARVDDIWKRLNETGVRIIAITEKDYPERLKVLLGKKAPPLLMVLGNHKLLNKPSVGFCGSRKASEKGLATARDCADQLAREGINIVSGYAAGVDMAAHSAALQCGGTTTLVLCEGILHFKIKKELKELWDWERIVVVSEFLPGVPWNVRNAMQRNKTIAALSKAMILIEARTTGGSIEAGRESIKMGVPLFAPVYEGMPESATGNQELLGHGARPLHKSRTTRRANLKDLLPIVKDADTGRFQYQAAAESPAQLMFFEQNQNDYGKK